MTDSNHGGDPSVRSFSGRKSWVLGAAMIVLLGFAVWLLLGQDAPLPTPNPTNARSMAGSAHTAVGAIESAGKPGESDPERTEVTDSSQISWVVRGEVMHGSVAPLPNASFEVRLFAGVQATGEPLHEATLTSDAAGGFSWNLPSPAGTVTLSFAQASPDITIMAAPRTVLFEENAPQDVTIFAFKKDCEVTGIVTDAAQRPIAGAWVKGSSRDEPVFCDAAGHYRLVASATYGDVSITAGAPDYGIKRQSIKVKGPNAKITVDVELRPAIRLRGRVTNEDGAPVATATVYTSTTHAAKQRTDTDGRFEIAHLDPARERHTIQVEHADYLTTQQSLTRAQIDASCELVLKRGAVVTGRVFGQGGHAVAGANVHLGEWIGYLGKPRTVSREDGAFEVRNAAPGKGQLSIFARGYAPHQKALTVPASGTDIQVHLQAGHYVAGRIVDRDGNGLHRIRVTPMAPRRRQGAVGSEVYSARDGSFRITDLPAGTIDLDCFGMQVSRKLESGITVDRADVTVVMKHPARLAGRVVDAVTGQPLNRFSIRFVTPELRDGERRGGGYGVEWSKGLVFEDTNGYWATDNERFEAGTVFGIEATAVGYGPVVARRAIADENPNPTALVLRLRRAARITGRLIDQRTGEGITNARLAVFSADQPLAGRDPFGVGSLACRTGERGVFEIDGVPAGSVQVVVQHPDWPITFDGPFDTVPGAATDRLVTLQTGAVLTGNVLDLQGNPLVGATFAREPIEIHGMRVPHAAVTTDAGGRFLFEAMPTGSYWFHGYGKAPDGSVLAYSKQIDVTIGETQELRFEPAGKGAIEVVLTGDAPLPKALSVRIRRPAEPTVKPFVFTVSGPTFLVRGLPAGDYQVSAHHFEGRTMFSGSGNTSVATGTTARLPIAWKARLR